MFCSTASPSPSLLSVNQEKNIISYYLSSSSSSYSSASSSSYSSASSSSYSSSSSIPNNRLFIKPQHLTILRLLPSSLPFKSRRHLSASHFPSISPPRCNSHSVEESPPQEEVAAEENAAPPPPSVEDTTPEVMRRLFVGYIPMNLDDAALETIFKDHGTVERAEVILNKYTQKSRKFGFVTMGTVEEAHRAIEKLNGLEIGGKRLKVNVIDKPYSPHPPFVDSPYKVFVANVPYVVTTTRLREFFAERVTVVSARVGRVGRKQRYFGMLTFPSEEDLQIAVALSGIWLDGKKLVINKAQPWQLPHCIMMMRKKDPPPK